MSTILKGPVMLYTESTPNPESLKFVTNRRLYPDGTADFRDASIVEDWSPLAAFLFTFPYVKGVYIANNFVTITKEMNYAWNVIMNEIRENIKQYIEDGKEIVKEGYAAKKSELEISFYSIFRR